MEEPMKVYGSTVSNSNSNAESPAKIRSQEDIDIQLHDFKGVNFKDPLIPSSYSVPLPDRKPAERPKSLLSHQSIDQPSIGYSDSDFNFNQYDSWWKHPRVRENWRVVVASAFLSIFGIGLILTGIIIAFTPSIGWHCLVLCFIGALCLIPGGYHFVYIYCAAMGRQGYYFENLPVIR